MRANSSLISTGISVDTCMLSKIIHLYVDRLCSVSILWSFL